MTKQEFVDGLAQLVADIDPEYVSLVTAYGAYLSNYGNKARCKNANNVFAILADENEEGYSIPGDTTNTVYRKYDSIKAAVEDYMYHYTYTSIEVTDTINTIIDKYNLKALDKVKVDEEETLAFIPTPESSSIVVSQEEVPSKVDVFTIIKGDNILNTKPNTIEDAIALCDQNPGYSVKNSKGILLYTSAEVKTVKYTHHTIYKVGRVFNSVSVALYSLPEHTTMDTVVNGRLTIWDGVEKNGRYRVCRPGDERVAGKVLGWIDKCNIIY